MDGIIYYIKGYEFFLLPFYLIAILFLGFRVVKRYNYKGIIRTMFYAGLVAKLLGSIAFALMQQYIAGGGDSFIYFSVGLDIHRGVISDFPSGLRLFFIPAQDFGQYYEANFTNELNYGYVSAMRNLFTARISSVFSIFGLRGYLLTSLFFGLTAFTGMWRMFLLFIKLYPSLIKEIALCFLFMPSVIFWGSGVLKDSICLGALGWLFTSFYYFFIAGRRTRQHVLIMLISFYCLFNIKDYIAASMLMVFIVWIVIRILSTKKKSFVIGFVTLITLTVLVSIPAIISFANENLMQGFSDFINESQRLYEMFGSEKALMTNINITNPTIGEFAKNIPAALSNCLYRPFIWEASNIGMLLAGFENLYFLFFSVWLFFVRGPVKIIKRIFSSQVVAVNFVFTLIFAILIGFTCFNFGTIVRYRLPCIPFFVFTLVLLYKDKVIAKPVPTTLSGDA